MIHLSGNELKKKEYILKLAQKAQLSIFLKSYLHHYQVVPPTLS